MRFIDALEQGKTSWGTPERAITTVVSKIFIFEKKVLKVYKHENFFFADLFAFESRKAFYAEDFFWNNTAAPEVYLHLWGVRERDGLFELTPPHMGEDFVIEMSRVDDSKLLTKLLVRNEISKEQAGMFIDTLMDTMATLTKERRDQVREVAGKGLLGIMLENAKSLHEWMLGQHPKVPKEESDAIYETLCKAIQQEPYFKNANIENISAAIDNNSDNLILLEERPSFIDIMPPMVVWRAVDTYATISRTILDMEILGNTELGDAARAAYGKYGDTIPLVARLAHELRAACIQWPYRHMLDQPDIAWRYGAYAKQKLQELNAVL